MVMIGWVAAAALIVIGSIFVVCLVNLFRAALSLALVLLGVAISFILLDAHFLAFAQILIYIGAILTLLIFGVMLTSKAKNDITPIASSRFRLPSLIISILLFAWLAAFVEFIPFEKIAQSPISVDELGSALITNLVLPFEVIGLIFVVAIVGAVASSGSSKAQGKA